MAPEPLVIVGTGCRFPGSSSSPSKLWELLSNPRDIASKVPADRFNIDAFYHPDGNHHGTTNVKESYFLSENIRSFDNTFFSISASEADDLDPQQRFLLEIVYESLEAAGLPLHSLQGSQTGVFCGVMNDDWSQVMSADADTAPRYSATGMARTNLANRVSYFFDWHGPSFTVDTACSSSMVALHQAALSLHAGECETAVVTGANLIYSPNMYVSISNLNMLSPGGRSRMWDDQADGYARGEGVASIVLKKLSDAIANNDPIECVIRGTGVNQDGRSMGLTVPSSDAQLQLIKSTYARAGLDPNRREDRCQYFEAHGTGTQAGDPQEASAIHRAFFSNSSPPDTNDEILHVGSIKTVIGHTEGTAGLAGVLKGSLSLQNGVIAPNLHFNRLNPALEPYVSHLKVPTGPTPWPELPAGVPRRVSVNSFGFGGTNAHAILERYDPKIHTVTAIGNRDENPVVLPFVFSAMSEQVLGRVLKHSAEYLEANPHIDPTDLAWTLLHRRSVFTYRVTFWAPTIDDLRSKIQQEIKLRRENKRSTIISRPSTGRRKILGVFTGQGAQWPQMGLDLITTSPEARCWFEELQISLDTLPEEYRPNFSLLDELSAPKETSRLHEAAISQPLCTAVQIVLVNLLNRLGISFSAVVGHSSGEICAAYSAGLLTATDAIRIAYLRGWVASSAGSPNGQPGAMMATGLSLEEATALCQEERYAGRVGVAASNSPASITLSGDDDAIQEIEQALKSEEKFARLLRVDTAYHSHHMNACSDQYLRALEASKIKPGKLAPACQWYSSVHGGQSMNDLLHLQGDPLAVDYWKDNMVNPVLFSQALTAAVTTTSDGVPDMIVEVGPHPALKGPALQTVSNLDIPASDIRYVGLASRGTGGIETFAAAIGSFWTYLGPDKIDSARYASTFSQEPRFPHFVRELPAYPFDHSQEYWYGTRMIESHLHRPDAQHMLLGSLSSQATEREWRWRNYLRQEEIEWLDGHQVQSQTVFPATGYIAMALEASKLISAAKGHKLQLVQIHQLDIGHAISFKGASTGVETIFRLEETHSDSDMLLGGFSVYADSGGTLRTCASGQITISWGEPDSDLLPSKPAPAPGLRPVDVDEFYSSLDDLGYGYSDLFRGIVSVARKQDISDGILKASESSLILHPAVMDTGLQSLFAALGQPGDGQLSKLHVPTRIETATINPTVCGQGRVAGETDNTIAFNAAITKLGREGLQGDISLFSPNGKGIVQFEGVKVSPLMAPTVADDQEMFAEIVWGPLVPNASRQFGELSQEWYEALHLEEYVAFVYIKEVCEQVTEEDRQNLDWTGSKALSWMEHVVSKARAGEHRLCEKEWMQRTKADVEPLLNQRPEIAAIVSRTVGENLIRFLRKEVTMLQVLRQDDILGRFYKTADEFKLMNTYVGNVVGQIAFRYPRMKILEIGGGTGSATQAVLNRIGHSYHSYTFTDISAGFFDEAQAAFADHADQFIYKALDIDQDPLNQGYEEHGYDLIIAANVLHATKFLEQTMHRVRRLLKPGGRLVALEGTNLDVIRLHFVVCGFEGWWLGEEDGRPLGAIISESQWEEILWKTGFEGFETITPKDERGLFAYSVFVAQAKDDTTERQVDKRVSQGTTAEPETGETAEEPKPQEGQSGDLILVGGATEKSSGLVEELKNLLAPQFHHTIYVHTLESLNLEGCASSMVTVLNIAEMDQPCFKDLTEAGLRGLKDLVSQAGKLLWVSKGDEAHNPYMNLSKGFLRTLIQENPHCLIQHLNIVDSDSDDASIVSTTLRRLVDTDFSNDYTLSDRVDCTEHELRFRNGVMEIPRILHDDAADQRFNASRRVVQNKVDLNHSTTRVVQPSDGGDHWILLDDGNITDKATPETRTIRVMYSTLSAVKVDGAEFLHLVIGRDVHSDARLLALADQHASIVSAPSSWCWELPSNIEDHLEATFLHTTTWSLLALYLVNQARHGTVLLAHEANEILQRAIRATATVKGVRPMFTTSKRETGEQAHDTIFFHERCSTRRISDLLPEKLAVAARFDNKKNGIFSRIDSLLPEEVLRADSRSLYSPSALLSNQHQLHQVASIVNIARFLAAELTDSSRPVDHVDIAQVPELSIKESQGVEIVDWTRTNSLLAQIQPASSQVTLSANKTYLLVGMSGDLGQSVSRWMITKGARNIVLTSRTPKVEQYWIDQMAKLGARVVPMAMDVSDKKSVLHVDRMIHQQLPPVGGVVNGAMVLTDNIFPDVSLEAIQKQFGPKVQGSLILDELYSGHDLDFFILFGSLVETVGSWSQSVYSAATAFMSGLIRSRHARNLVGSIIHPGVIGGVGYVSNAGASVAQHMKDTTGTQKMSERALYELFAEAILAGPPQSGRNSAITAGMTTVDPVIQTRILWYQNPKAWNFVHYHTQSVSNQAGNNDAVPLKTQLAGAETVVEAAETIREGFSSTLAAKLQLPSDVSIAPETRLTELGVDSLVAVDIRMWFTKELSVNMSVLQIMSGSSVSEIASEAASKLPAGFLPNVPEIRDPPEGKESKDRASSDEDTSSSYEMVSSDNTSETNQKSGVGSPKRDC